MPRLVADTPAMMESRNAETVTISQPPSVAYLGVTTVIV